MDIKSAKELYMRYNGHSFHMGREEPGLYDSFRALDLDDDTLGAWDEELLTGLFERLRDDPDRVWIYHGEIIEVMKRGRCDTEARAAGLLDEMEKMAGLDIHCLAIIIENMAGRTESMRDGGARFYFTQTSLGERMVSVTERLIAATPAEAGSRFSRAAGSFRRACIKWA